MSEGSGDGAQVALPSRAVQPRPGEVLSWLGPAAVLGVAVVTLLAVVLSPAPHLRSESTWLRSTAETLVEPGDRLALVGWYVVTVVLALGALRWSGLGGRTRAHRASRARRWDGVVVVTAAVIVLGLVWSVDPTGLWLGLSVRDIIVGWALAVPVITACLPRRRPARAAVTVLAGTVLVLTLGAWIQVPALLVDPYDFRFSVEEVSSVAAGHVPLGDFTPQYSVLLPYLFALPMRVAPAHAAVIALGGLLLLQVVTLGAATALPVLLGGRRFFLPAVVVVLPTIFVPLANGSTVASYFQGMPLRDVLPTLSLLAAFLVLRRHTDAAWRRPWPLFALGLAGGITALNNPDFGLAAAGAIAITAVIAQTHRRAMARAAVLVTAGVVTVFGLYWIGSAAAGVPARWSHWLAFQTIFGANGFLSVAMGSFGLHVVLVGLFAAASATGFVLVRRALTRGAGRFAYRQGILLALVGGWSMGCLPYIAGRSLPATYIGGVGFNAALVTACLLPLAAVTWRCTRVKRWSGAAWRALVPLVMAVGATLTMIVMLPEPGTRLEALAQTRNPGMPVALDDEVSRYHRVVAPVGAVRLDALPAASVVQALPVSSLFQLAGGPRSVAVTTAPDYLQVSGWFSRLQCSRPWPAGAEHLLVDARTADILQADPACTDYADWSRAVRYQDPETDDRGSDLILAPRPGG